MFLETNGPNKGNIFANVSIIGLKNDSLLLTTTTKKKKKSKTR